jgi:hypothetical protein
VATGKIMHSKRRRRVEFLDFVESVTSSFSKPPASHRPRQPEYLQDERALARAVSQFEIPFHANQRVLAQSGQDMVLNLREAVA